MRRLFQSSSWRSSPWLPLILAFLLVGCDGMALPSFGNAPAAPTGAEPAAATAAPEPAAGPPATVAAPATVEDPATLAEREIGENPATGDSVARPSLPAAAPRPAAEPAVPDRASTLVAAIDEEDEEDEAAAEQERTGESVAPPRSRGFVVPAPAGASGSAIRSGQVIIGGIRAARIFAGPGQYPPDAFAAYGILAFPARAARADLERHTMLCEAYVAALPHTDELLMPMEQQMVTVWPVNDDKIADDLNAEAGSVVCERAITNYHLPVALRAIADAGRERIDRGARGPFLLAWSPAQAKGDPEAPVLMADLSDVTNYEQARAIFVLWRTDIEANPAYWEDGWSLDELRQGIRLWVDRVGPQIFSILGA